MVAIQSPFLLDEEDDKSVKENEQDVLKTCQEVGGHYLCYLVD